ncbi:hypothetical protein [Nocardia asteroides]|uniref:hypothetical protein n=1 Tax=Nocardia asteroides TaxID=1824 RepID=UPI001E4CB4B9|nr:hypothetical protein [Nocardia asteroides]UGT52414.1 hypothetical protein LTT85_16860 [Nocardia asteroides]
MTRSGRARAWVAGYCAVLALIIVGPLAGSGYLLLRDAVSTPRSYLTDSALGLGAAAPRAVPQDALLATLSPLIDGGLLVKAILITALWAAGYGAAVLARELLAAPTPAQLVAATLALWNPFVAERLLQGHWSLLAGYAALPWTAVAASRIRRSLSRTSALSPGGQVGATPPAHGAAVSVEISGVAGKPEVSGQPNAGDSPDAGDEPNAGVGPSAGGRPMVGGSAGSRAAGGLGVGRGTGGARAVAGGFRGVGGAWAALVAGFAAAGLTPTGSLLAAVVGLALVGRRGFLPAVGLWIVTCAPWLTATALGSGAEPSDPAGVSAFAARAEPWLGTLGSLAGLGGIWNSEAVPTTRTTPLAFLGTVLLLAIVALGVRAVWGLERDGRTLLIIAAAAILLPALGATGPGLALGEWLVVHVPGAGLLRDTQKYVALAMPAYALCAAAACQSVRTWARRFSTEPAAPVREPEARDNAGHDNGTERATDAGHESLRAGLAAIFIALLILPLADLAWGVGGAMRPVHYPGGWEEVAERIDSPGDVAVLPTGMFRVFPYSGTAPVLDPAPRILPNDVLQTGELLVRGHAVTGEGNRARTVEEALIQGAPSSTLADLGVGWILVERTTPGPRGDSEKTLSTTELVHEDHDLALYRIPSPTPRDTATPTQRRIATAAHLLWATTLLVSLITAALPRSVPRRAARMSPNTPTE